MGIAAAVVWITFLCCTTATVMFWMEARSKAAKRRTHPADPEQILAERFARGELDEAEYAQRLAVLRVGPPLDVYIGR
jgi:putative membrane protein